MSGILRKTLVLLALSAVVSNAADLTTKQKATLPVEYQAQIAAASDAAEFDVLVRFSTGGGKNTSIADLAASASDLRARYSIVGTNLRDASRLAQDRALSVRVAVGRATVIRRFWISNAVQLRVDRDGLLELAGREDVIWIAPNDAIELLNPVGMTDAGSVSAGAASNVSSIGTRALWARGLTGKGRLVASIDTGVEGIHPALSARWRGRNGDLAAAWFDPLAGTSPSDNNGHGTHVMGIMVGRDGADTIGVAPDAEWITAAVIDRGRSLGTTFADILAALEWIVDPDGNPETMDDVPDVVCNSWGVSQQVINACNDIFFDAIDNVEALGIVCVFAAGNEGPYSMSIRNPADRSTSPTASFSVGSVDATSASLPIPSFSSRGPAACDGLSVKPELVAPGVSIRSSFKGQTYKLVNGTSMSAPHVAAGVALLRQYNPDLTPEEIKTALLATAIDVNTPGEDNASGKGMVDLEAALDAVRPPVFPRITMGSAAIDPGGDGVPAIGESVDLIVPLSCEIADANDVTLTLTALSSGINVVSGVASLGTVNVGRTVDNAATPFVFEVTDQFEAGQTAWFEIHLSGNPVVASWRDSIGIVCGVPSGARIANIANGGAGLSLSNFGQFGLADGSCLGAGGGGWTSSFWTSNLMFEGALIASSADGGWSDASRRQGGVASFDFVPVAGSAGDALSFDDSRSPTPVGIEIDQRALHSYSTTAYEYTTVAWTVRNRQAAPIDGTQLAMLLDIDLPRLGTVDERVSHDQSSGGIFYTTSGSDFACGIAPMSGYFGSRRIFENNSQAKRALSNSEKMQALKPGVDDEPSLTSDYFTMVGSGPFDLGPGDTATVAMAFITAAHPDAFTAAAADARNRWLAISDVGDDQGRLRPPSDYRLDQNYPNPFNAGTTIPVFVGGDASRAVRLDIIDVLGRRVRTAFDGILEQGEHALSWDGVGDGGQALASGVYFSRLIIDGQSRSARGMVLLK